MGRLKAALRSLWINMADALLPRSLRLGLIKALLLAETRAEPRESVRWMLGVLDYTALSIDMQAVRWGNGVHIKHELMDGIHEFFYTRIPAGANVLDLGCGHGVVANALATHAQARVFGIDLNPAAIAFAQERYKNPNLTFLHGDVFKDIPELAQVDVIVLSSVLEHLENRAAFLRQLTARFHPQKFLIRVPTLERTHYVALKRELGLNPFIDPTHVLEYTPASFQAEMEQAGLTITHLETRWGDLWAECQPNR